MRELLERKARDFYHAIIDRRFKAGRRFARDIVFDFIECVADREFCRDFRNRKPRCLRCQRTGTRDARIHLDHDHAAVVRVDSKLNVRSSGLDTDLTNDRKSGIAHHLVFLVSERLNGRDRDRIAGVHTHGIEILDGTDDHTVVHTIAHHFHLEFFPADQ